MNTLHPYHASKLQFNHELRQNSTRQDDCFALIKPNSLLKINSLNYKIGVAWNNIPKDFNLNPKNAQKNFFVQKYNILFYKITINLAL